MQLECLTAIPVVLLQVAPQQQHSSAGSSYTIAMFIETMREQKADLPKYLLNKYNKIIISSPCISIVKPCSAKGGSAATDESSGGQQYYNGKRKQ